MKRLLNFSTPASAASFLVVGVTGTMMLFHVAQQRVETLHEWAGLTAVAAVGLHIVRNWKAFLGDSRRGVSLQVALSVAALGAVAVLTATSLAGPRGGLDALRVRIEHAPLREIAPIVGEAPEHLVTRLQNVGLGGVTAGATPEQIAIASGKSSRDVLEILAGN